MKTKAMRAKKAKVFKKPKNLKMSKRSEKALDKTIIRWVEIKKDGNAFWAISCECCVEHLTCFNCPIHLKSGRACHNTPYREYADKMREVSEPIRKRLAQDEIEFLQSCYY